MFASSRVTVGTDPIIVLNGPAGGRHTDAYLIRNLSTSVTVYLGGVGVTDADGYPLGPGEPLPFSDLGGDDDLYGVVASDTAEIAILEL